MKNIPTFPRVVSGLLIAIFLGACKTTPYAPPAKKAIVESVEVKIHLFEGRPDAYAIVKGRLSSTVAQLVDASQTRDGRMLHISVMEQTPRGAIAKPDLGKAPTYEKKIPIDLLGLKPGNYTIEANGVTANMEVPKSFKAAPQQIVQQQAPHKVKWRPAPLPAGTVKMLPPVQVNQQPVAARQMTQSVNARIADDPFNAKNQPLPPGMSASVAMAPPLSPRMGQRPPPVLKKKVEQAPIEEDIPTIDSLLGSNNTVSTLSN